MILIYSLVALACLVACILVSLFLISELIAAFHIDAPFVPIPSRIEDKIIETLNLNNESILYDLGCGNAIILKKAVEKHPGIRAIGVEIAFFPYLISLFNTRGNKNIEIRRENIFDTDTKDATHVFLYLYPKAMEKLMPVLEKKCKAGTRIVSCDFEDKNRKPEAIIILDSNNTKRGNRLIVYAL